MTRPVVRNITRLSSLCSGRAIHTTLNSFRFVVCRPHRCHYLEFCFRPAYPRLRLVPPTSHCSESALIVHEARPCRHKGILDAQHLSHTRTLASRVLSAPTARCRYLENQAAHGPSKRSPDTCGHQTPKDEIHYCFVESTSTFASCGQFVKLAPQTLLRCL